MNFNWHLISKQVYKLAFIGCVLYACCSWMSCNNAKKQNTEPTADSTVYYPINNFIRQQIKQVDTTPYYVYRVLVENGKRDSTTINRAVFDSLANQFILPELEEKALRKNFIESVYEDQSTNSITLTYTPKDSNNIVQNTMVLLDPVSQNIKWIFINTLQNSGDSTIIQKIGWKGSTSAFLNRSVSYADGRQHNTQLNIVWNDK